MKTQASAILTETSGSGIPNTIKEIDKSIFQDEFTDHETGNREWYFSDGSVLRYYKSDSHIKAFKD